MGPALRADKATSRSMHSRCRSLGPEPRVFNRVIARFSLHLTWPTAPGSQRLVSRSFLGVTETRPHRVQIFSIQHAIGNHPSPSRRRILGAGEACRDFLASTLTACQCLAATVPVATALSSHAPVVPELPSPLCPYTT